MSQQTVPMPADVNRPDRLLLNLTARQVAILAATALGLWSAWQATKSWVPPAVALVVAVLVGGVAVAVAVGRRDGQSIDQWLLAALRHCAARRRFIPDPAAACRPAVARWRDRIAALPLPLQGINDDGILDLGSEGEAAVIDVLPVNFDLRTDHEQRQLMGAIGGWLNGLDTPAQIIVRSRRLDLTAYADGIAEDANRLPDPALEAAALRHAEFLDQLAEARDITHRQVLVVHRDTSGQARRLAARSAAALAGAELQPVVLDGDEVTAVLADCLDPYAPPIPGAPDADGITTAAPPPDAAPADTGDRPARGRRTGRDAAGWDDERDLDVEEEWS